MAGEQQLPQTSATLQELLESANPSSTPRERQEHVRLAGALAVYLHETFLDTPDAIACGLQSFADILREAAELIAPAEAWRCTDCGRIGASNTVLPSTNVAGIGYGYCKTCGQVTTMRRPPVVDGAR